MNYFSLKKWYFDLITPAGDGLYLYFIIFGIAGLRQGMVSAHLRLSDGREVRASLKTGWAAPEANGDLSLGPHSLCHRNGHTDVRLEFANLTLLLRYRRLVSPWQPASGGVIWRANKRYLSWVVPQPAARVEGLIDLGIQKIVVQGEGYQDIVETNVSPWTLPVTELLWGRAHCEGQTIVFNQVRMRDEKILQSLLHQRAGETDRPSEIHQEFDLSRDEEDRATSITTGNFSLTLTRRTILEQSRIATGERFKSGFARALVDYTCGRPEEKKMISEAVIELDGQFYRGQALHERAVWHWPKKERT
jgi:hypothetical protein